ncbi:sensor histidine kinase [Pelagibacterium montanilacus]|uniref:sensor histidine kinase n=1 Tax=Pelagibacterium montanilacus TaxID=2185280 RepID=UPI0013DEFDA4|nr:PAS domain-containing protein [Pelagibacterium montanilacus]
MTDRARHEADVRTRRAADDAAGMLQSVIDAASDAVMIFESVRDEGGRIVDFRWTHANEMAETLLGRPRSWFLGAKLLDKLPGNREAGLFDAYRAVTETRERWSSEFTYAHEHLDAIFRAAAHPAGDGFIVSFSDVTEQRRTEALLEESEERLRMALEAARGVGIWDWDLVNDHVYADATFTSLFGIDPSLADTNPPISAFLDGIHPDDRHRVSERIEDAIAKNSEFAEEYRCIGYDKKMRWVFARGRCIQDGKGHPVRFPGMVFDISDRKKVEEAWRESEAKFEAIVNSIDQMIWSTRPDGFHDYYNSRWYEFTGVPAGSTDGEGWSGMFHPDDQDRAWARWRHSLETGEPYHIEYRLRHRSGQYRWVIGRAQPVRDGYGRIKRWFGTCTDIHDLKSAEEQLELVARELSHRIKNIFTLIMSLVSLSSRTMPEAAPFAGLLRARIEALSRAYEFVRPATVPSGGVEGSHTIAGLFETLFAAYREDEADQIEVRGGNTSVGPNAATTLALVFHELATNAIKYGALSNPGGRITVDCVSGTDDVRIVWSERGGPVIDGAPTRQGFGTAMSRRAAAAQLAAQIEHEWRPQGLVFTMRVPTRSLEN